MSRDTKPRLQTSKPRSGSRGGTLIGIFVGLILGALVAAGIALYFTAASPFQKPKQQDERVVVVPPPPRPQTGEPIALPGKAGDKPVEKPRFDFYNVLPKGSDALPAPSKPEETTEVVKADKPAKTDKPVKAEGDARGDKTKPDDAARQVTGRESENDRTRDGPVSALAPCFCTFDDVEGPQPPSGKSVVNSGRHSPVTFISPNNVCRAARPRKWF